MEIAMNVGVTLAVLSLSSIGLTLLGIALGKITV